MSAGAPIPSLSLRDTLTRVIPGVVVLSPLLISANMTAPSVVPSGTPFYIIVALLSYLIGEIIDQFRAGLFRVPMTFRYFIYKQSGQIEKMPRRYRWIIDKQELLPERLHIYEEIPTEELLPSHLDLDFREDMESELGVDFDENRPRDIYDLLLVYMDSHFTARIRRQQSLAIFSSNLRMSSGLAGIFYLYYVVMDFGSLLSIISGVILLAIVLIMAAGWPVLTMAQYQYGELLMKEYYGKRHSDISKQH